MLTKVLLYGKKTTIPVLRSDQVRIWMDTFFLGSLKFWPSLIKAPYLCHNVHLAGLIWSCWYVISEQIDLEKDMSAIQFMHNKQKASSNSRGTNWKIFQVIEHIELMVRRDRLDPSLTRPSSPTLEEKSLYNSYETCNSFSKSLQLALWLEQKQFYEPSNFTSSGCCCQVQLSTHQNLFSHPSSK